MLQEDWETTKLNVPGRQKVGGHSWKYLEHVQLYSDLLQALKRVSLIALDSLHRRTLISASAVPRCGAMECKTEGCPTQYICVIRLGFIIQCAVFECAAIRRPTFTQNLHKTQQDGTKQYKTIQIHILLGCWSTRTTSFILKLMWLTFLFFFKAYSNYPAKSERTLNQHIIVSKQQVY